MSPPCPTCRTTIDLKCFESFGCRHISYEGKLYFCNNPMYPPDEGELDNMALTVGWFTLDHRRGRLNDGGVKSQ
jgi:hypothetical protein